MVILDILQEWLNTCLREFICDNTHSHDLKLSFILCWVKLISRGRFRFDSIFTFNASFSLHLLLDHSSSLLGPLSSLHDKSLIVLNILDGQVSLDLVIFASKVLHALVQIKAVKSNILAIRRVFVLLCSAHSAEGSFESSRFMQELLERFWSTAISIRLHFIDGDRSFLNIDGLIVLLDIDRCENLV